MHSLKSASILFLLLYACTVAGCFHAADRALDKQCSDLADSFFHQPFRAQIEEFGRRSLEDQYTLLICGNQVIHPPALYLVRPMAQQGQAAAVFLKQKLLAATDDLTIRDIVMVFVDMNRNHDFDVAGDKDLMALIDSRARSMKDPGWKNFVNQRVAEIIHPASGSAPE